MRPQNAYHRMAIIFILLLILSQLIGADGDHLFPFRHGAKYGFIDKHGYIIIKAIYDRVFNYSEGLAAVKIDDNWGYINGEGKIVVKAKYDYVESFSEGLAAVDVENEYGFINTKGELVIKPQYDDVFGGFSYGLCIVKDESVDNKKIAINTRGQYVSKKYDDLKPYSEGLAAFFLNGKWGFINTNGIPAITPCFDFVGSFSQGFAVARTEGKVGYIDKTGEFVISPRFEDGGPFSENLASIKLNGKWGYINRCGVIEIRPTFHEARIFSEGYANVKLEPSNFQTIFVDRKGHILEALMLGEGDFKNGLAQIINFPDVGGVRYDYIDKSGKVLKICDLPKSKPPEK